MQALIVETTEFKRSSSITENSLPELAGQQVKQSSASVASTSDAKQNFDELPDTFDIWSEGKWKDTELCEICQKKFSFFSKRHHWYICYNEQIVECVENAFVKNAQRVCANSANKTRTSTEFATTAIIRSGIEGQKSHSKEFWMRSKTSTTCSSKGLMNLLTKLRIANIALNY